MAVKRSRRGFTLVETMIAAAFMVMIIVVITGFSSMAAKLFAFGRSDSTMQAQVERALQRMAKDIRAARSLSVAQPNSSEITLQLPAYNNGDLTLPITNGNTVRYQIQNATVNGTAVRSVVRTEAGTNLTVLTDLGTGGTLTISQDTKDTNGNGTIELNEVYAVNVAIEARQFIGGKGGAALTRTFASSEKVYLFNRNQSTTVNGDNVGT